MISRALQVDALLGTSVLVRRNGLMGSIRDARETIRRRFGNESVQEENPGRDVREQIRTIAVLGAGQMGTGIALVAAQVAKLRVLVYDKDQKQINRSLAFASERLMQNVRKGKLSEVDAELAMTRIAPAGSLSYVDQADFVIEAAVEDLEQKRSLLEKACGYLNGSDVIIASNTSSFPIASLASATDRPSLFIGMHFFNPVPVMPLVEMVTTAETSPAAVRVTRALAESMQKTVVSVKDSPGFVSNRLLMPYINEAALVLDEKIASAQDIDAVMTLGMKMPMGPLALADLIGIDTCLFIMRKLHNDLASDKYKPARLLEQLVAQGRLGRKTGHGFHNYDRTEKAESV